MLPLFDPDPDTWRFSLRKLPQTGQRFSDYVLGQLKMRLVLGDINKTQLADFSTNFTSGGEIRSGLAAAGHAFRDSTGLAISCGGRVLSGFSCIEAGGRDVTTLKDMPNYYGWKDSFYGGPAYDYPEPPKNAGADAVGDAGDEDGSDSGEEKIRRRSRPTKVSRNRGKLGNDFVYTKKKAVAKSAEDLEIELEIAKKKTEKGQELVKELEECVRVMIKRTFEASTAAIRASVSNILELEEFDLNHKLKNSFLDFLKSQIAAVEGNTDAISYTGEDEESRGTDSDSTVEGSVDIHNRLYLEEIATNPGGLTARMGSDGTIGKGASILALKNAAKDQGWTGMVENDNAKRKAEDDGGEHRKKLKTRDWDDPMSSLNFQKSLHTAIESTDQAAEKSMQEGLTAREKYAGRDSRLANDIENLKPRIEQARTSGNKELLLRLNREHDGKSRDRLRIKNRLAEEEAAEKSSVPGNSGFEVGPTVDKAERGYEAPLSAFKILGKGNVDAESEATTRALGEIEQERAEIEAPVQLLKDGGYDFKDEERRLKSKQSNAMVISRTAHYIEENYAGIDVDYGLLKMATDLQEETHDEH